VHDADGQLVSGYSAPSQSFDFKHAPVPELTSLLLLVAGPVALTGVMKCRRRPTLLGNLAGSPGVP
jgi:hypothetical protein